MTYNIAIHGYIVDYLSEYGTLSDVVNKIVDLYMDGSIPMDLVYKCPDKKGCRIVTFSIKNEIYNNLIEERGKTSYSYSLRRLIYSFVYERMPDQLGWTAVKNNNKTDDYLIRCVSNITMYLDRINRRVPASKLCKYKHYLPAVEEVAKFTEEILNDTSDQ